MFLSIFPFAIVFISIYPPINSLSVNFTIQVIAHVDVTIAKAFVTFAFSLILSPTTFVMSTVFVYTDPETLSLILFKV